MAGQQSNQQSDPDPAETFHATHPDQTQPRKEPTNPKIKPRSKEQ